MNLGDVLRPTPLPAAKREPGIVRIAGWLRGLRGDTIRKSPITDGVTPRLFSQAVASAPAAERFEDMAVLVAGPAREAKERQAA
ncbi:MAG: hypothetical protein FJ318_05480 [SAR202 cluster bacterium]|nr:hypothetical protein [SAR202 cluster bacterium]